MRYFTLGEEFKEVYQSLLMDDFDMMDHPYSYITKKYSSTLNAKVTGLPGFTPPTYVQFLNGLSAAMKVVYWLTVVVIVIGTISLYLLTFALQAVTDISIQYSGLFGKELWQFKSGFTLTMTPIILAIVSYISSLFLFIGTEKIAFWVSKPYEQEYERWLKSLQPTNNAYPPEVRQALVSSGDTSYHKAAETAPKSAPPQFREPRLSEKILALFATVMFINSLYLFRTFNVHFGPKN